MPQLSSPSVMAKSRVDRLCEATAEFWDNYLETVGPVKPIEFLTLLERFRHAITEQTVKEAMKFNADVRKL